MTKQLRIYESMSKLGARVEDHNDGVKRNLEADEWRTPVQGLDCLNIQRQILNSEIQFK